MRPPLRPETPAGHPAGLQPRPPGRAAGPALAWRRCCCPSCSGSRSPLASAGPGECARASSLKRSRSGRSWTSPPPMGGDRIGGVPFPHQQRPGPARVRPASRLALSIQTQPNGARLREPVTPVLMSRTLCNQKHPYRLIMAPVQVPATSSSPSAGPVRVGRAPVRALRTAQLHMVHRRLRQAHLPAARLPERPSRALAGPAASSRVTRH
jgi:hypothetical protein